MNINHVFQFCINDEEESVFIAFLSPGTSGMLREKKSSINNSSGMHSSVQDDRAKIWDIPLVQYMI